MAQALFDAIKAGDLAKVKEFLKSDKTLADARSKSGTPAAVFALYYGRKDISDAILAAGPTLDLPAAAAVGQLARVKELVSREPKSVDATSADGNTGTGLAAYLGHPDIVEFLLSKGANVNYAHPTTGFTALTGAVAGGHEAVVKILVRGGADVNHRYEGGNTPLTEAAFNGNLEIVRLLIDGGADPNVRTEKGQTPLSIASEKGHTAVADFLRKHGAHG